MRARMAFTTACGAETALAIETHQLDGAELQRALLIGRSRSHLPGSQVTSSGTAIITA